MQMTIDTPHKLATIFNGFQSDDFTELQGNLSQTLIRFALVLLPEIMNKKCSG